MAIISEAGRQEGWEINNHHRLVLAVLPNNSHCIINRQNKSLQALNVLATLIFYDFSLEMSLEFVKMLFVKLGDLGLDKIGFEPIPVF